MQHITAQIFDRLSRHYGPQHWWPGDSPFEVIVGAILTQNTSWKNVEHAIGNLREANLLDPSSCHALSHEQLSAQIRPAGYFRLKARRLKNFLDFLYDQYDGSLDAMFTQGLSPLREQLLTVNGIGPETADSILLYAGNLPTFVVDTYTQRVLKRHAWIDFEADYYATKEFLESNLALDVAHFNEFHALFVRVGNQFCRPKPRCDGCPLESLLSADGPLCG